MVCWGMEPERDKQVSEEDEGEGPRMVLVREASKIIESHH